MSLRAFLHLHEVNERRGPPVAVGRLDDPKTCIQSSSHHKRACRAWDWRILFEFLWLFHPSKFSRKQVCEVCEVSQLLIGLCTHGLLKEMKRTYRCFRSVATFNKHDMKKRCRNCRYRWHVKTCVSVGLLQKICHSVGKSTHLFSYSFAVASG